MVTKAPSIAPTRTVRGPATMEAAAALAPDPVGAGPPAEPERLDPAAPPAPPLLLPAPPVTVAACPEAEEVDVATSSGKSCVEW